MRGSTAACRPIRSAAAFLILGRYGYNGQSYFGLIETQMRHITRCLARAREDRATVVEIRPEANKRFFEEMLAKRGAMGIAVINELYLREEERLVEALGQDDWLAAVTAWAAASIGNPRWMRLELEIAASSTGDDEYRTATAARYSRLRARRGIARAAVRRRPPDRPRRSRARGRARRCKPVGFAHLATCEVDNCAKPRLPDTVGAAVDPPRRSLR